MRTDMCKDTAMAMAYIVMAEIRRWQERIAVCIGMRIDMCIDMCTDMCTMLSMIHVSVYPCIRVSVYPCIRVSMCTPEDGQVV